MHIAVVGKGTSSIITCLSLVKKGHKVTVFYDPETKHINVGESTTPHFAELINEVLGISIHDLCNYNVSSIKTGIKFIDWGKGKSFQHNFATNKIAFHFQNTDFNPFLWDVLEKNNLVSFIPQKVNSYIKSGEKVIVENYSFDFIIFCNGWSDSDVYETPFFKTVNTALLYTKDEVDVDNLHTIHKATENGWEFGLPFPRKNITKCGYLFDRDISNSQKIIKDFENKNIEIYEKYEWTPKYAEKIIQNDCCAYNGNRLFFLEPLQAMSLYYTICFCDYICDFLEERTPENLCLLNIKYQYDMWEYQMSIAYHYNFGSVFTSDFWKNITDKSKIFIESFPKTNSKNILKNLVTDLYFKGTTNYCGVGCFGLSDVKQIHSGMADKSFYEILNEYKEPFFKI